MLQQDLPQDILAHPSTWLLQDPPDTGEAPRSSVDEAIARAAGRTKSLFSAHWVHIETPVNLPHVAVEASQLDDTLAAMLERACQHALVGSRIDIEAWCDPSWVFIAVMAGAAGDSADRDTDGRPSIRAPRRWLRRHATCGRHASVASRIPGRHALVSRHPAGSARREP